MKVGNKKLSKLEDLFVMKLFYICFFFALVCTFLYYKGYIQNVRGSLTNVITFASLIFVVLSLILTLLISLKNGPLFNRIGSDISKLTKEVYKFLNKIILTSAIVVLICLVIGTLPININRIIKIMFSILGFTTFWYMFFGVFYMLIFTTDLVVKDTTIIEEKSVK